MAEPTLTRLLRETLAALTTVSPGQLDAEQNNLLAELAAWQPVGDQARQLATDYQRRERTIQFHFDYALSGIIETRPNGCIVDANPAAASISRRDRKQLTGRTLAELFDADSQSAMASHLQLIAEQGIGHVELSLPGDDGPCTITMSSVQVDNDLYLHVIDDVTEDRRLAQALVEARQAAEAANAAKGRFLANVSHEIRTPMNGIIGLTQLALMDASDPGQRDYLEKIAQSGRTLLAMLNDLLDFAKIEAGKMEFEQRPVDWHAILEELSVIGAQAAADKPIDIVFDLAPEVPRYVLSDPIRLKQILINLLGNAIKFTERGQIVLKIAVADGGTRNELAISVSDTGCGIAATAIDRLFQPFTQEDAGTTRRFGGTGLGLAIARQLASGLGGELTVQSVLGQGSCFTLTLVPDLVDSDTAASISAPPLVLAIETDSTAHRTAITHMVSCLGGRIAEAGEPALKLCIMPTTADSLVWLAAQRTKNVPPALWLLPPKLATGHRNAASAAPENHILSMPLTPPALLKAYRRITGHPPVDTATTEADIPTEFRGACIAVAEDTPVNQQVICGLLERAGIQVLLADNGKRLIDKLAAISAPPELILMDVHMPEMDGLATTRALRANGYRQPIIALSAGVGKDEQAECLAAGMSDFLGKPIDIDELWGLLTCWLPPRSNTTSGTANQASATPTRQPPPAWLAAAGLQIDDALCRYLGDGHALAQGVLTFCRQHAETIDALELAVTNDDPKAFRELAHALRGTAGTIGADTLATLSHQAENLPADNWPAGAIALLAPIRGAFQQLASACPENETPAARR